MNYGEYLKEIRLLHNKTLKQLSEETNISFQNLSRWERGEVLPNIDFCVKLADYYQVSLDELIGRKIYTTNEHDSFTYFDGIHYINHNKKERR